MNSAGHQDISRKQKIEIEFWRDSRQQSPESDSVANIVNTISDAAVFLDCLKRYKKQLSRSGRVLELGAGQGWASCIYKKLNPKAHVTVTDLSEFAVMSLPRWERIFEVKIDQTYACTSYETQEEDASLDLVFCFAAAHHFLAHKRTLNEIFRVLKPGAKAIYFHEPASIRLFYSLACRRMNKKRAKVPEDVLIISEIKKLAGQAGLDLDVDYYPSLIKRGPVETVYFYLLSKFYFLNRVLPSSVNLVFTKPKNT